MTTPLRLETDNSTSDHPFPFTPPYLDALAQASTPGEITFDDPDAIIVVETLAGQCGLACWTRANWQTYSFLKRD
jgi:hypothetical protein